MFLMVELRISAYYAIGYSRGSILLARLMTKDGRVKKAVLGGMGNDFTNPNWKRRIQFSNAFKGEITEETKGTVDYARSINADFKSLYLQQKYQPVTTKEQLAQLKIKVLVIAGDKDLDNGSLEDLHNVIPKSKLKLVNGDHNNAYKTVSFSKEVVNFL